MFNRKFNDYRNSYETLLTEQVKFKTLKRQDLKGIEGTSKQGTIKISLDELVEVLGEPSRFKSDGVRVEWDIRFSDGTYATIYDWHTKGPIDAIETWNVGGTSMKALWHVMEILGLG